MRRVANWLGWICVASWVGCGHAPADRAPIGAVGAGGTPAAGGAANTGGITLLLTGGSGGAATSGGGSAGALPVLCGNASLDAEETCDDANSAPGDGCSGVCLLEPGYECPTLGQPCRPSVVCGDGAVGGTELCDDGNTASDDGCVATCTSIEDGFSCPVTGGECTRTIDACGNRVVDSGEDCDDGDGGSDGCTADCRQEPEYLCPPGGGDCSPIQVCGDGVVSYARNETCDDGNTSATDGCSELCRIESGWVCTGTPSVCTYDVVCGDRRLRGGETCDDGNATGSDGCSAQCKVETGWTCPTLGAACRALCGDGVRLGREECDDRNTAAGDGCSPTCQEEPGWVCPTGQACRATVCGNGQREGSESCDDGNKVPFDGCSPTCVTEPRCGTTTNPVGACTSVCGDGILLAASGEQCDDGNRLAGDGCSATCRTESGYVCEAAYQNPPATLRLPIIYRDFGSYQPSPNGHPDFGKFCCGRSSGIVQPLLGADRKPVYAGTDAAPRPMTSGKTAFDQWYRDVPAWNHTFHETLTLRRQANGVYSMNSDTDQPWYSRCGFYPVESARADDPNTVGQNEGTYTWDDDGNPATPLRTCQRGQGWGWGHEYLDHNYLFSSELRYWFEYRGGEQLDFSGDDDVWVFVNGRLALDLGGVEGRRAAQVTLPLGTDGRTNATYQLTVGNIYEIVVFQAERWCCGSNYWLSLSDFIAGESTCEPKCGDGVVTPDEACDLGTDAQGRSRNTGVYGGCTATCTLAPFCGDGLRNGTELCDDGANRVPYDSSGAGCAPGCVRARYCGDGVVDSAYGEQCDRAAENAAGAYGSGACTTTCQLAPFCGDGLRNGTELCDDGPENGTTGSPCDTECRVRCGNGVRDPGEACDLGKALNTGEYGGCTSSCTLGPRCGDGQKNGSEACDDGVNDGSYGTCQPNCTLGPYCGDALRNGPEQCDRGPQNTGTDTYGPDICTTQCVWAPYCGDRVVQPPEECDGTPECTTSCRWRPVE